MNIWKKTEKEKDYGNIKLLFKLLFATKNYIDFFNDNIAIGGLSFNDLSDISAEPYF